MDEKKIEEILVKVEAAFWIEVEKQILERLLKDHQDRLQAHIAKASSALNDAILKKFPL